MAEQKVWKTFRMFNTLLGQQSTAQTNTIDNCNLPRQVKKTDWPTSCVVGSRFFSLPYTRGINNHRVYSPGINCTRKSVYPSDDRTAKGPKADPNPTGSSGRGCAHIFAGEYYTTQQSWWQGGGTNKKWTYFLPNAPDGKRGQLFSFLFVFPSLSFCYVFISLF